MDDRERVNVCLDEICRLQRALLVAEVQLATIVGAVCDGMEPDLKPVFTPAPPVYRLFSRQTPTHKPPSGEFQ